MPISNVLDYKKNNERDKNFCNEQLYEEVSEELRLDIGLVKEVVGSNSKFAKSVIEAGALESFILPYLGKLKSKPRSLQKAMGKIKRG